MARFYNTANPRYVDDFVFDPNIELAQKVIAAQDARGRKLGEELNLYGNLPLDYHEKTDRESALRIKREYEARVDEFMNEIGDDWLNTNKVNTGLAKIRRDVEEAYNFGEIKDLSIHKNRIDKMYEDIESLEAGDRERYINNIVNPYIEKVEGRGIERGMIDEFEVFETENYFENFVTSLFDKLKATEISKSTTSPGIYIVKTEDGTKEVSEERIKDFYKAYIKQNPNIEGRARIGEENFGERWFDEQGDISFSEDSFLGKGLEEGLAALAWSDVKDDRHVTDNVALRQVQLAERAEQRALEAATERELLVGTSIDASEAYLVSRSARLFERDTVENFKEEFYMRVHEVSEMTPEERVKMNAFYNNNSEFNKAFEDIPTMMEFFGTTVNSKGGEISVGVGVNHNISKNFADEFYRKALAQKNFTSEAMQASNMVYANHYGMSKEAFTAFEKEIAEKYKNNWPHINFQLADDVRRGTGENTGKRITNKNTRGVFKAIDFAPDSTIGGKYMNLGKGKEKVFVTKVSSVDTAPQIIPLNKDIRDSEVVATFSFTYTDGTKDEETGGEKEFTVERLVIMDATSVTSYRPYKF